MEDLEYPGTEKKEITEVLHGREISDPYRWLEDIDSPETRDWIEKQNRLTEDFLKGVSFRGGIKAKLEKLWETDRYGVCLERGGRYFFTNSRPVSAMEYNQGQRDCFNTKVHCAFLFYGRCAYF